MTVKEKGFSLLYRKILPSFNFSFLFLHKNQWLSQTSYEVIYYEYYSVRRGLYLSKGWLLPSAITNYTGNGCVHCIHVLTKEEYEKGGLIHTEPQRPHAPF